MRDDPTVIDLVNRARDGDKAAWDQIVERYATLVWSVCHRHGLSREDADDVGASVWLRVVEKLGTLHEPAALPGWIATITKRECLHLIQATKRQIPVDDEHIPDTAGPASDEWLLKQEQQIALREAFAQLPESCQRLLSMLFSDPPTPYSEISTRLGLSIGGIGPSRLRCLRKLREVPVIAALLNVPQSTVDKG